MIKDRLTRIFRDVFCDDSLIISDDTSSADIEDWDSLAHIQLITETENEFGIKFTLQESVSAENVKEFIDIIEKKIEKNNK